MDWKVKKFGLLNLFSRKAKFSSYLVASYFEQFRFIIFVWIDLKKKNDDGFALLNKSIEFLNTKDKPNSKISIQTQSIRAAS